MTSPPLSIAVIGAGITGVTTAYSLLMRGFSVDVFERHPHAALETSYANGGQLSASNAEVWTNWSTLLKALRWMLRSDAPLLFNPFPSLRKYDWVARFLAHIPRYQENTLQTVRMAIEARDILFGIAEREGIDFSHVRRGILHVYEDAAALPYAHKVNQLLQKGGLERYYVSNEQMHDIEPTLTRKYCGGFYTPLDSTGDIRAFTRGLAAACVRHGGKFYYDETAAIAPLSGGQYQLGSQRYDAVVICAGVSSRDLAQTLGDFIPIYPVKGYSITVLLDPDSQSRAPWVSLLDEEKKIVTSRLGEGFLRVAGTAEFNGYNYDIRADRIRPLVDWTRRMFPGISVGNVEPWAVLRPMTPDLMPCVRPGKKSGVFYNTGHGHLGWTLSALTAETVASYVALWADKGRQSPGG